MSQTSSDQKGFHSKKREGSCQNLSLSDEPGTPVINGTIDGDEEQAELPETTVWIRCDVYDTGIGIPGMMYACLLSLHCQKKSEILLDISVGPVWGVLDTFSCLYVTENALPTLFKKYMQVNADHARKYGGTGLGLAICKQLVKSSFHQHLCFISSGIFFLLLVLPMKDSSIVYACSLIAFPLFTTA